VADLEASNSRLKSELASLNSNSSSAALELSRLRSDLSISSSKGLNLEAEIKQLKNELSRLQQEISRLSLTSSATSNLEAENSQLRSELSRLQNEIASLSVSAPPTLETKVRVRGDADAAVRNAAAANFATISNIRNISSFATRFALRR
jgi:chromosome segregation ATPase